LRADVELKERRLREAQEQNRRAVLEKVIHLGKTVTEVTDFQTTLLRIWKSVRNELDFDRVAIYLYNPVENVMQGAYGTDHAGNLSEIWNLKFDLQSGDPFFQLLSRPDGFHFTHDFAGELGHEPSAAMLGVKEHVSVAVWAGDKPVAVITADQLVTGRLITEEQLEGLRLFAGYAGLAIENAHLSERERSRQDMLEKVIRLGKLVTGEVDYRTALLRIWNGIRDDLGFDRVGIFTYDASRDTMHGSYGTDREGNLTEEWQLELPAWVNDFFGGVLRRPDGFYFTSDYEKGRNLPLEDIMSGVKYYAAVSAWAGDKPIAIICVDQLTSGHQITDEQLEALRFFAGYAGLAIENAHLGERERSRQEMLEKVIRLGKLVTGEADYRTVLIRIFNGVRDDLGFDRMGLFIYDASRNTMRGSFGTDRNGNMAEEWDLEFPMEGDTFFSSVVSRPDSYFFTNDYETERKLRPNHIMGGVKYYAAVSAWAGDKPVAIICVDQLISGRQITEEQLEALRLFAGYAGLAIENSRLKAELEQRVRERTTELEVANQELESFSYSVSHDLRAPLRAINGFSKILDDDFTTELNPTARGFVKKIIASGDKMGHLIDDLLNFSRLGRKPLAFQPVDMNAIVQSVLETLSVETADRQIEWILSKLPVANADPVLTQQVYANLIGNAIKYSRNRQQARIEIGSLNQNEELVYFVRDNGAGFDMQFVGRLFGVFQRLHREEEFEGTGIGLAIVKRIIQRHGGRVWAEAEVDKGATFYFTLG
jgi:signal transduction histidine kinase